ncbi:unnamed protein product [Closterium sp. NIES-54]
MCGLPHTAQRCFGRLIDTWRAQFPDAVELPRSHDLLRQNVAIFDLDFDAILAAMYALIDSAVGDCYLCLPPDPGIEAADLGASASAAPGTSEFAALGTSESAAPGAGESALSDTAPTEALHTFTLDSRASRSFFRDSTTLMPLSRPVVVSLADPFEGPVFAHSSTVLPCRAAPSGLLSGLHLPSFSTNLVSGADLQDLWVDQFTPGGQRVTHCTSSRTGRHLATFTRWPGSSPYTLTTEPPPITASGQVAASGQVFAATSRSSPVFSPCSCRPLSHETLLWHHRLGHPSLPRLRGMASRTLRAAPHSSSFPPTEAPLQTLHMDVWGPARIRGARCQLTESFGSDLPVLRVHSDKGGEFSSDLLRAFCRAEGIRQTFTLPASPQKNGIAECRIRMVMDVARTSMIHAAAPHFLWPFAVQYVAHQINLQPHVSLPETTPTLRWTEKVGDASVFRDVTFDDSVSYYRLFPYRTASLPPPPLFLAPSSPPVDPLPPQGLAPSVVSQVDPVEPIEVAVDSSAGRGAEPAAAGPGGAEPGVAKSEGAEPGGAEPERVEPGGAEPERAESGGPLATGPAAGGASRAGAAGGAAGAGAAGAAGAVGTGAVGGPTSVGAAGGTGAAGLGGARTGGTGATGASGAVGGGAVGAGAIATGSAAGAVAIGSGAVATGGAAGAGAAGGTGVGGAAGVVAGDLGAEGPGAVSAVSGGAARPRPYYVLLLQQPASPLPGPSPYSGPTRGITEHREPESCPASPESRPASLESRPESPIRAVRTGRRVPRQRPPPVPGTHSMTLRPSTAPQRSTAASALVAELANFAAACRLDYAASLVAESESASVFPPSIGGECALGTDVLKDRQEEFECCAAALPHLVSMLLAHEEDPDAPDIPTPRSYVEAIEDPYSSQWQTAMDTEMASSKSTGTYVDEVPPPGANIVSGMWIFRVKRPPGSPPVFKARHVERGFSQRQGVNFFQNFSPTPKMTTLRVLLHVAAQRDYELHSLDFSTAFLQGSLHEEILLRRPPGFTGSFTAGTQWILRRPVYGLREAPREWHDTLRTTLAALGFAPSTAELSLFLRTDTTLPPFYVIVYVDDLVFATDDTEALAHVKSELLKRHTCTDLAPPSDESVEPSGPYPELVGCLMYLMTCTRPDLAYPLSILARYVALGRHRKEHMDAAKRVLRYLCSTSGMGLVLGGRARVVLSGHAKASWVDDLATQRSSQGYTFSLGSGSVSWRSTCSSSVLSSSCEAEIYAGAMAAQ